MSFQRTTRTLSFATLSFATLSFAVGVTIAAMLATMFAPIASAQATEPEVSRSRSVSWTASVDMHVSFARPVGSLEGNYWIATTTAKRWPTTGNTAFELLIERWDCAEGLSPAAGQCEHRGDVTSTLEGLTLRLNRRAKKAMIAGTIDMGGIVQEVAWKLTAYNTPETTSKQKTTGRYEWTEPGADYESFLVIRENTTSWAAEATTSLTNPGIDVVHTTSSIEKKVWRSKTNTPIDDIPPGA